MGKTDDEGGGVRARVYSEGKMWVFPNSLSWSEWIRLFSQECDALSPPLIFWIV